MKFVAVQPAQSSSVCDVSAFEPDGRAEAHPGSLASADVQGASLSKSQQKKLLARQMRQDRKGQKKLHKQTDAIVATFAALDNALPALAEGSEEVRDDTAGLRRRLCGVFGTQERYRSLPLSFGPQLEEGLAVLGPVLLRPPKYGAKFLPQEYSLLHKMWVMLGGACAPGTGVLDIGAGNANCAVLAAALLGLTVICVERESPREELRAEARLPEALRRRVVRVEADVEDFGPDELQRVASAHGLRRLVLVAKHPCGIGADRSIECTARLCASRAERTSVSVEIIGVVMATCCTNKLCLDDARISRVAEFCRFYAGDVPGFGGAEDEAGFERAVEVMSRCSAWRTASESLGNAIQPEQLEWAELFEDALQTLRLRRLAQIFGASSEIRFAPRECTLQDRCLVAAPSPIPEGIRAHGEASTDPAFLMQLRTAAAQLLADTGPIDCRPLGLKSAKYDFDYTDMPAPSD